MSFRRTAMISFLLRALIGNLHIKVRVSGRSLQKIEELIIFALPIEAHVTMSDPQVIPLFHVGQVFLSLFVGGGDLSIIQNQRVERDLLVCVHVILIEIQTSHDYSPSISSFLREHR